MLTKMSIYYELNTFLGNWLKRHSYTVCQELYLANSRYFWFNSCFNFNKKCYKYLSTSKRKPRKRGVVQTQGKKSTFLWSEERKAHFSEVRKENNFETRSSVINFADDHWQSANGMNIEFWWLNFSLWQFVFQFHVQTLHSTSSWVCCVISQTVCYRQYVYVIPFWIPIGLYCPLYSIYSPKANSITIESAIFQ